MKNDIVIDKPNGGNAILCLFFSCFRFPSTLELACLKFIFCILLKEMKYTIDFWKWLPIWTGAILTNIMCATKVAKVANVRFWNRRNEFECRNDLRIFARVCWIRKICMLSAIFFPVLVSLLPYVMDSHFQNARNDAQILIKVLYKLWLRQCVNCCR